MVRKKTHEEFLKEVKTKYGNEYMVLSTYENTATKIKVRHNSDKCGSYEWYITPNKLLLGRGCPICGEKRRTISRTKTHEKFIKEIRDKYGDEYKILSKYINAKTKIKVRHNCGHEWEIKPSNLLNNGQGCPICSNQKVKLGINTIWDTDRWMVDLGVSEEDAKKYTHGSGQKITVKCPDCGREKKIKITHIYTYKSICCPCGDGKSYPEKFIMSVLKELNLDFGMEYSPTWADNKRYDFYIGDINGIIEVHGCQHYKENFQFDGNRTLKQEQANDEYKREIALQNGIKHYIELDCRESNLDYIKNSVLNSELSQLFDLSKVNWISCAEFANKNIVKEVCEYWNNKREYETTSDLEKIFKLYRSSIVNYLKKGTKLGWCKYDPKEEVRKVVGKNGKMNGKRVEIFKDGKSLGIFESCSELERQSEKLFEVKLNNSKISSVCRGKRKQHKGFTFKYIEDNNLNISKIA